MGGSAAKLMCRETELVDPNLNRFRMHQDVETRPGSMRCSLLQFSGDLFGVLLMPLEYLETGLQQTLEFGIACGRNERRLERAIHCLVIRNLISNVSLVEFRAIELRQCGALFCRLLG